MRINFARAIVAGIIDNPPAVSCRAALPTAICPSAVPPAPSAARTAPSAMYRFISTLPCLAGCYRRSLELWSGLHAGGVAIDEEHRARRADAERTVARCGS